MLAEGIKSFPDFLELVDTHSMFVWRIVGFLLHPPGATIEATCRLGLLTWKPTHSTGLGTCLNTNHTRTRLRDAVKNYNVSSTLFDVAFRLMGHIIPPCSAPQTQGPSTRNPTGYRHFERLGNNVSHSPTSFARLVDPVLGKLYSTYLHCKSYHRRPLQQCILLPFWGSSKSRQKH